MNLNTYLVILLNISSDASITIRNLHFPYKNNGIDRKKQTFIVIFQSNTECMICVHEMMPDDTKIVKVLRCMLRVGLID